MYPNDIIFGIDLYEIFFTLGLMLSVLSFRFISDRLGLEAQHHNMALFSGVTAIVGGYFAAILMQAVYDFIKTGVFDLGSGMTYYGGFIGGALTFIAVYFISGAVLDRKKPKECHSWRRFFYISDIGSCSVVLAHATGRIGCIFAGCCHGSITDAWYGIYNCRLDAKAVPVPLFEAAFLFALFGFLLWRVSNGKTCNLALYLSAYGVWRFFIEYLRDDDRGETLVSFLSPSQLTAVILFTLGIALYFFTLYMTKKFPYVPSAADSDTESEDDAEADTDTDTEKDEGEAL